MPSPSSVREQLTDILVRVVGCPADAVVPSAKLKDLGTDSIAIVEVGEELGRRFGVYLSDTTIDSMTTVQDAIDAVVNHDSGAAASQPSAASQPAPVIHHDPEVRRTKLRTFAATFVFFGLVIGGAVGLGGAALVSATGISKVDLPAIGVTATPTPKPEPATKKKAAPKEATPTDDPKPTINTSSERVAPGERFLLSGAFPGSPDGQTLQVEVKDGPGAGWDDFPIQTQIRDGGIFRTELYTSRTGERTFRIKNTETGETTPTIKVTIG
ncbi:acyl carrier protein [Aeromicrobium wangtongii]|uniref:acyl carrier protein n=1 Tax=Aeromicrobium wangtongii TaxID=2969247 RepID=UPI002016B4C0|nr:phosphopantetheine-binding protein [Aeromicrobium wangtongii]MCL3818326.1 phosphopantetheine-binding protein [Aeromicrobium wangtongii]